MSVKILLGGSPCTYWSIAQKNNRETEPSGLGWELFRNYCIAKEKFKPDFFLYENNKSAAKAIKEEIKKQLQVDTTDARYIEINSALVSAQNRQRFYVHNCGDVGQPEDRKIVLKDILESTTGEQCYEIANLTRIPKYGDDGKARPINAHYSNNSGQKDIVNRIYSDNPNKQQVDYIVEPMIIQRPHGFNNGGLKYDKAPTITANGSYQENNKIIKPVRVGKIGKGWQGNRIYDSDGKAISQTAQGGGLGSHTGLYAIKMAPCGTRQTDKSRCICAGYQMVSQRDMLEDIKTNGQLGKTGVIEPIRIGDVGSNSQAHRVYSAEGKSVTINSGGGGQGGKTGLYACPVKYHNDKNIGEYEVIEDCDIYPINETTDKKSHTIKAQYSKNGIANFVTNNKYDASAVAQKSNTTTKKQPVYEVKNEFIIINDKQYPIKLPDGFYIIRKLTVTECCRLQTLPDKYCRVFSSSQAYRGLGNGWTAEVIIHILQNALKNIPKDEKIIVLSMYDGIGTGRYCLDKLGFTNVEYYAYEIDKYAMQIANSNYPDIMQMGDAFEVRKDDWKLETKEKKICQS